MRRREIQAIATLLAVGEVGASHVAFAVVLFILAGSLAWIMAQWADEE